jgi:hypothetical protein
MHRAKSQVHDLNKIYLNIDVVRVSGQRMLGEFRRLLAKFP